MSKQLDIIIETLQKADEAQDINMGCIEWSEKVGRLRIIENADSALLLGTLIDIVQNLPTIVNLELITDEQLQDACDAALQEMRIE